jgi:hypothetical protein
VYGMRLHVYDGAMRLKVWLEPVAKA